MTTPWHTPEPRPAEPVETASQLLHLADIGRWLTLKMLSSLGPMTARSLSSWTKLDEKDTMLQLRALRQIGLVERDASEKADRHAEWRSRPGEINATAMTVSDDPAEREAAALWGEVTSEARRRMASDWYRDMHDWSDQVRREALNWDRVLPNMTVEDLTAMAHELLEFMAKWLEVSKSRAGSGKPEPGSMTLLVGLDVFPVREVAV